MDKKLILILFFSFTILSAHGQTKNLDYYLNEGIKNSPLLNDYRNQISSANADSQLIKAAKKPLIEANSLLQYSPYYNNFGYDEVITDGGNYSALLSVNQNIFNRREIENKYEAVSLLKKSVNNASRLSVSEISKVIINQYLTAYSGFTDLTFNKGFLNLLQKEDEIVRQFVKNGVAKQTDYLSLRIETQTQEILVLQLHTQYLKDLMLLNQLCGLSDTSFFELTEPAIVITGTDDISRNPGFIQYTIDSIRIQNEKAAVDIKYKPKVNWFADAGTMTSNPWNFYRHFGYSAGISLNIPVYDGNQRNIEKQKLDFNENTLEGYKYNYRNQYYQQINRLNEELRSLNELTSGLKNQLVSSDQLVKVMKEQLEAGIIMMTEYINAIKNFRTINRELNIINIQKLQVINEMNYLIIQK